jgi:UDP-N-acetylmuramyl pentapeptide synthase
MAVLGDMLELGAATDEAHLEVGRIAGGIGLHRLVTMGESARRIGEGAVAAGLDRGRWIHVESHRLAGQAVAEMLRSGDALLIKGSRGMGMENVVGRLRRDPV